MKFNNKNIEKGFKRIISSFKVHFKYIFVRMNKFSLIITIIFALTGCCLAGRGWKNNPDMKIVKDAVCDVNKRPDETQWTNLLNCNKDNNQSDPRHQMFAQMVRIVKLHKRISKLSIHKKNILSIINK
jgi:hypothetical protein